MMGKVAGLDFLGRVREARLPSVRARDLATLPTTGSFAQEVDGGLIGVGGGCGMNGCDEHLGIPPEALLLIPNIVRTLHCRVNGKMANGKKEKGRHKSWAARGARCWGGEGDVCRVGVRLDFPVARAARAE